MMVHFEQFPFHPWPTSFNKVGMVKSKIVCLLDQLMCWSESSVDVTAICIHGDIRWYLFPNHLTNSTSFRNCSNHSCVQLACCGATNSCNTNLVDHFVPPHSVKIVCLFFELSKICFINLYIMLWFEFKTFHDMLSEQTVVPPDSHVWCLACLCCNMHWKFLCPCDENFQK